LYHSRIEFSSSIEIDGRAEKNGLIAINSRFLNNITRPEHWQCQASREIWQWVMLAYTLLHELSHRVHQEYYPDHEEMFFENDKFQEIGYALEKYLTGGALREEPTCVVLRNLPVSGWLQSQDNQKKAVPYPITRPKGNEMIWFVDDEWFPMHFDPDFWSERMPKSKGYALRLPREEIRAYQYAIVQSSSNDSDSGSEVSKTESTTPYSSGYGHWPITSDW
jgi:hypothetical protein